VIGGEGVDNVWMDKEGLEMGYLKIGVRKG
jgi:hypothetical protein